MKSASRVLSFLALPLFVCAASGSAAAADPAPTPAELLKLYQSLGLPLPPDKAKLVRYERSMVVVINGQEQPPRYGLAFEIKPGTRTEGPVFFRYFSEDNWYEDTPTREVKPDRDAVKGIELSAGSALMLAAQCRARGGANSLKSA